MRDYLNIGPTPCDEKCIGVGENRRKELAECRIFANQIRRVLGAEPDGARLIVKSFPHDFGTYSEVCCEYDDNLPASVEYAFKCESESPANWDAIAQAELAVKFAEIESEQAS